MRWRIGVLGVLCLLSPVVDAAPPSRPPSNGTVLRKLERANDISVVIASRAGTTVVLDPRAGTVSADAVLVTHDHQVEEHVVGQARWRYARALRGDEPGVHARPGRATVKDVALTGVAASHYGKEIASPPDYVIWLVEVDGLRIAYFPCLVQDSFTPAQLAALGRVDVALFDAEDDRDGRRTVRSFALARQLRPRLLIPLTHRDGSYDLALGQIEDQGGKIEVREDPLLLSREELGGQPERVVDLVATATSAP